MSEELNGWHVLDHVPCALSVVWRVVRRIGFTQQAFVPYAWRVGSERHPLPALSPWILQKTCSVSSTEGIYIVLTEMAAIGEHE